MSMLEGIIGNEQHYRKGGARECVWGGIYYTERSQTRLYSSPNLRDLRDLLLKKKQLCRSASVAELATLHGRQTGGTCQSLDETDAWKKAQYVLEARPKVAGRHTPAYAPAHVVATSAPTTTVGW